LAGFGSHHRPHPAINSRLLQRVAPPVGPFRRLPDDMGAPCERHADQRFALGEVCVPALRMKLE
jgi:hypothetical protein